MAIATGLTSGWRAAMRATPSAMRKAASVAVSQKRGAVCR
jgi:hypothetical protein